MTQKQTTLHQLAETLVKGRNSSYRIIWQEKDPETGAYPKMKSYTWDGSVLRMSESDPLLAIHDVAHILLATDNRIDLPEFGLGPDPSNGSYNGPHSPPKAVVSAQEGQQEENRACHLHWALAAYLEGTPGALLIQDYLNMQDIPSEDEVRQMGEYTGMPDDFVANVLQVWEPLHEARVARLAEVAQRVKEMEEANARNRV